MERKNKYSFFVVITCIIILLTGCSVLKKPFYSYIVNSYGIDTVDGKKLYFFNNMISCGDYLFEFVVKINVNKSYKGAEIINQTTKLDTTGVYILSAKNKQFYLFDTFTLTNKLTKSGPLADKKYGQRISFIEHLDSSDTYYGSLKNTTVNGIPCYTSELIPIKINLNDSIRQEVTLIKKENFNSLYKFIGVEYTDKAYCIIGINVFNKNINQDFVQEIENLRELTEQERNICNLMLKKAGLVK